MATRPLDEQPEIQKGPEAILVGDAEGERLELEVAMALSDQLGDQISQTDSRCTIKRSCQSNDDGILPESTDISSATFRFQATRCSHCRPQSR